MRARHSVLFIGIAHQSGGPQPSWFDAVSAALREPVREGRLSVEFAVVATHNELRDRLQGGKHELIHVCGRTGSLPPLDDFAASELSTSLVFDSLSAEHLEIETKPDAVELRCVVLTGGSPFSRTKPKPVAGVELTIAMPGTLEHGSALEFARVFYTAVAAGLELESAYKEGVVGATDHDADGIFESMLFRAGEVITTRTPFDELRMLKDSARTISARILAVQNQLSLSSSLSVGDLLAGRFVLQQLAAFGGFCEIWKAYDRESHAIVAVKIMHDAWARTAQRLLCFEQAALSMSQVHHPGLAEVISSVERDAGRRFFVMRWYAGGDLRRAFERGLTSDAALRACADAIDGLAYAHKRHLLHRDIKPRHILLDELGHGHLTDFDLYTDDQARPGLLRGTTAAPYAAPEMRVELDARADLYGMAMCVLFALLGEDPPIDDPIAGIAKLEGCTKELAEALRGALAFDKRDRTTTLTGLADAVRQYIDTPNPGRHTAAGWAQQGEDQFGRWAIFEIQGVQQRMRWIAPGRFSMGSSAAADMSHIEGWRPPVPVHSVTLSQGFWLAESECTQALWEAVMGANPSNHQAPEHPVETVSWNDVQQFLERLNKLLGGLAFKLPTEAQWEYACRANTNTATYAEVLGEIAWYAANSNATHVVAQKRCNQWGLYDTLGNVWEWCEDSPRTYHGGSVVDPVGPHNPQARMLRGGGWLSRENFGVRASDRMVEPPTTRDPRVGFRLARLAR
jgi:formylglycine-generating enzyme required for sulfatase activity